MADEKAAEAAAPAASSGGSGGGGGKLVLILTLVNVVATVGMGAVLMISFQRDRKQPSVEDIAAHDGEGEHGASADAGGHGGGGGGHGEAKSDGGHGGGHGGGGGEKKHTVSFGKMVQLEQFTVNLATPGSAMPKFVRVAISLEVPTDDAENEVTQKMPQVRNAVIDLFNSKRPADLATAEGRDYLKEEIRNALNGFMVTGKIKGVFFTSFALSG